MASPADIRAGGLLAGRYELREPLGRGGCATVFAARDLKLDREVAVKVWHDPSTAAAESRLTARLRHPGIVVVHDAQADGEVPFLVMELVHGVSLETELALGPLPPRRAAHLVAQLARTLSLVHDDGFVHGDVKPGNVLLGWDDQVTLADFGVAGPSHERHEDVALGTPQYLSPEQVQGKPVTPATDVYALGLVLLECLTATRAFPGTAEAAAVARLRRGPAVPSHVSPALAGLIRSMTELEPGRRPSASEVARELESYDGRPASPALVAAGPPTQPVATEVRPAWTLVGAALVVVLLALALTGPRRHLDTFAPAAPPPVTTPVQAAVLPVSHPAVARPAAWQPTRRPAPPPAAPVGHHHGHGHGHGHRRH